MRRGQRSEASRFLLKMHLLSAPDSVRFSHSTTDRYPRHIPTDTRRRRTAETTGSSDRRAGGRAGGGQTEGENPAARPRPCPGPWPSCPARWDPHDRSVLAHPPSCPMPVAVPSPGCTSPPRLHHKTALCCVSRGLVSFSVSPSHQKRGDLICVPTAGNSSEALDRGKSAPRFILVCA